MEKRCGVLREGGTKSYDTWLHTVTHRNPTWPLTRSFASRKKRLLRRHFHLTDYPTHPFDVEPCLWGAYALGLFKSMPVDSLHSLVDYFYLRDWKFCFTSPLQTQTRNLSGLNISNSYCVAIILKRTNRIGNFFAYLSEGHGPIKATLWPQPKLIERPSSASTIRSFY